MNVATDLMVTRGIGETVKWLISNQADPAVKLDSGDTSKWHIESKTE